MKKFEAIHSSKKILYLVFFGIRINVLCGIYCLGAITCVRWDLSGERLASTSYDGTVKVLDFASEKVIYAGKTEDRSKYFIVYLIIDLINFLLELALSTCFL